MRSFENVILPILFVSSATSTEFERDNVVCTFSGTMEVGSSSTIEAGESLSTNLVFSKDFGISCISATNPDLQSGHLISKNEFNKFNCNSFQNAVIYTRII